MQYVLYVSIGYIINDDIMNRSVIFLLLTWRWVEFFVENDKWQWYAKPTPQGQLTIELPVVACDIFNIFNQWSKDLLKYKLKQDDELDVNIMKLSIVDRVNAKLIDI